MLVGPSFQVWPQGRDLPRGPAIRIFPYAQFNVWLARLGRAQGRRRGERVHNVNVVLTESYYVLFAPPMLN